MTGSLKTLKRNWPDLVVILLLFVAGMSVYLQAIHFDFVQPEDAIMYSEASCRMAAGGTPWGEFLRMPANALYWVPVSNFILFMDVWLCGGNTGMLHLVNLTVHAINGVLLFLVLRLTTASIRKSAFAAAFLSLHPINTEAVVSWCWGATQAEAFLFLFTFLLYINYARKPSARRYVPVVLCFGLGLLARPSILYLPCLLLLFDFWPLGRWRPGEIGLEENRFAVTSLPKLIVEKVPLLMISAFWLAVSLYLLRLTPAFPSNPIVQEPPFYLLNLPVAYVLFLWALVSPLNLPFYFPYLQTSPFMLPLWQVIPASIGLLLVSAAVIRKRLKYPFLVTGWFWFLIALSPSAMICVQQQKMIMARLGYLPMIGIFILVSWGGSYLLKQVGCPGKLRAGMAVFILVVFSMISWSEARCWSDRVSYFKHAAALHPGSAKMHVVFGEVLNNAGRIDEAVAQYEIALRISPDYAVAHNHLAMILVNRHDLEAAVVHLQQAVRSDPGYAQAHNNLANLLADLGNLDGAIVHYKEALRIDPKLFQVHNNLASVLLKKGEYDKAISHLKQSLAINPGYKIARDNLTKIQQLHRER